MTADVIIPHSGRAHPSTSVRGQSSESPVITSAAQPRHRQRFYGRPSRSHLQRRRSSGRDSSRIRCQRCSSACPKARSPRLRYKKSSTFRCVQVLAAAARSRASRDLGPASAEFHLCDLEPYSWLSPLSAAGAPPYFWEVWSLLILDTLGCGLSPPAS